MAGRAWLTGLLYAYVGLAFIGALAAVVRGIGTGAGLLTQQLYAPHGRWPSAVRSAHPDSRLQHPAHRPVPLVEAFPRIWAVSTRRR